MAVINAIKKHTFRIPPSSTHLSIGKHTALFVIILLLRIPLNAQIKDTNKGINDRETDSQYEQAVKLLDESLKIKSDDWKKSYELAKKSYEISTSNGFDDISVKSLLPIAEMTYYNIDRDTALTMYMRGMDYAKKLQNDEKAYAYSMKIAEWHLYRSKDYDSAEKYFLNAIDLSTKINAHHEIGRAYSRYAIIYVNKKDLDKVDELSKKSAHHFLLAENRHAAAYYYCDIGKRLWEFDMKKAVDYYLKGLEMDNTHYYVNLSIGNAYISLGLPEVAISHLNIALDSLEVNELRYGVCINDLADANVQLGNYSLADSLCNFNIETYTIEGGRMQDCLSKSYLIKGTIQELKGNDKAAFDLYETALAKAYQSGSSLDKTNANLGIGEYYLKSGETDLASKFCKRAYNSALRKNRKKHQSRSCECIYTARKRQGKYEQSLAYLEEKDKLDKSLNASTAVEKLTVYAKLSLREKEVTYQQKIKDEQLKSQKRKNLWLRLALLFGAIFMLLLFRMLAKIVKQNKEINLQSEKLKETNVNLSQSNEALERFAHIVSHDLKTPMLIIIQYSKMLSEKLGTTAKPLVIECLDHIEKGGDRMLKLIEGILEFSKNPSDQDQLEKIKLGNLFNQISELLLTDQSNSKIVFDAEKLPTINWNHTKLLLLFKNLIENGLKYNQSEFPTSKIYTETTDTELIVFIDDNGIGIDEEHHERIFTMFSRLHNHHTYSGTGIGLATCKKLVQGFGGRITLDSQINEGSTFMIHFPLHLVSN